MSEKESAGQAAQERDQQISQMSGQIERLDDFDDLYQAGLAADQLKGRMSAFADCFDVDADCSDLERRVIADLKAYLRPSKAPASLARRCCECLEKEDETGGRQPASDDKHSPLASQRDDRNSSNGTIPVV